MKILKFCVFLKVTNHKFDPAEYDAYCQLLRLRKIPQEAIKFLSCLFSLKESDAQIIDGSNSFMKVLSQT